MARRNTGNAVAERIEFRIGINVGDVVVEDGDIFGDGVNIAARLEGLAEPGGICVSARVQEDAAGRLDLTFDDLGEQNVKNIVRPIRAFALTADTVAALPMADTPAEPRPTPPKGPRYLRRWIVALTACGMLIVTAGLWWLWQSPKAPSASTTASVLEKVVTAPAVPRLSMVVLPFANLSSDPDQEYFADAITDDLDDRSFTDSRQLRNRTQLTAFTYKGKAIDVKQIGRDLGVHYVLEGSVRRLGDSVQVNVQLLDSESGAHVWADRLDTDRRDLAEAQSEITGRLARMLNTELIRDIGRRIEQERAADPDARDLVMRARALYMQGFSAETNKKVLDLSERALAIDRDSVDARISIGQTLAASITDNWSNDVEKDQARAEQLLLEALDRDRNRSSAHGAMGLLRRVQGRWAESQADLA